MLHELLMMLNGYSGSIFFDSSDGIKISSGIPNLHPAEKTILERLCILGTKCKFLSGFVKKHKQHSLFQKGELGGLYLESFCGGLDDVLSIYYQELVDLERNILKDPFLPLTYFLKLGKYLPLFEVLSNIVSEITKDKIHGCRILDLVYNQCKSGVKLVEVSMNKVLQHCHTVMFRQIFSWIMSGTVVDPFKEFFIQPDTSFLKPNLKDGSKSHESTLVNFSVKAELLPSYIPSSLAAKILFVGEYVSVLGASDDSNAYSLFLKKEHIFADKIEKLMEKNVFSLLSLETTIDDIKQYAAKYLWQVIVKNANVVQHLKIIKEFYLLGHGELFLDFIGEANQLLRMPVTTTAESDANKLFHSVARQIFPDDDSVADKFHIILQAKSNKSGEIDREDLSKLKLETGWSCIGLIYDVPHPLHILITPSVINRYNTVFRFLLSVRKVQIELHQCWALQMRNKGACHSSVMPFWKLRSHMSFLVDNFQYYVLVDVLESCFNNLLNKMENVEDFEEIQQYHDRFLSSIISQCFLELKSVFNSLNEILDICSSFCSLINRVHMNLNQRDITQFENIKADFQHKTYLLFRVLSGVRSHQVSPHLAQLLLRIDYNKFLSSCGGQFGGTPTPSNKI